MTGLAYLQNFDDRLRKLKDDLYVARRTILHLMPDEIQSLLGGYSSCQSRDETHTWENNVLDRLITYAKPLLRDESFVTSDQRALCPLCAGCGYSPYATGYSIPEGLRRHLGGWGNTRRCDVMHAVLELADDYWNTQFREIEERQKAEKEAHLTQRRTTEPLYLVRLDSGPCLIDEHQPYGTRARDEYELAWAEQRLTDLGFIVSNDGNVKRYTNDRPDCVVFTDPRAFGQIDFAMYKKPVAKNAHLGSSRRPRGCFSVKDNWKRDLMEKYEARLASR